MAPSQNAGRRFRDSLAGRVALEVNVHAGAYLARQRATRKARSPGTLILGPWTSEVGFELLYWIPYVRGLLRRNNVPPDRVVAVSRGGVSSWYAGISDHYIDILDLYPVERLRRENAENIEHKRGQKQLAMTPFEVDVIAKIRQQLGEPRAPVLHPSVMYRRYFSIWMRRRSPEVVRREALYAPLSAPRERPAWLPREPYVALKAYYSAWFPQTTPNVDALRELVARLARQAPVVLINSGHVIDDHADVSEDDLGLPGLISTSPAAAAAADNLGAQSAAVAAADVLMAPYGGFSYLGPFLQVPTYAFHSHDSFNSVHLDLLRYALNDLRASSGAPIPYLNFSIDDVSLIDRLAVAPHE